MDQVDSLNLTYDHLDECQERVVLLEQNADHFIAIVNQGIVIEHELNEQLEIRDTLISERDTFIQYQRKQNKKLKRQNKILKIITPVLAGTTIIFGIIVWLPP